MNKKRKIRRWAWTLVVLPLLGAGMTVTTTGCNSNRYLTFEDGDFDGGEYDDTVSDQMTLNSELEMDSQEHE